MPFGKRPCVLLAVMLLAAGLGLRAQSGGGDAAEAAANAAYKALKEKDLASAVRLFREAVQALPDRVNLRKDFAYTLLRAGEREEARDQFEAILKLDARDEKAALEYGFLCYETRREVEARRVFARLKDAGQSEEVRKTAGEAFENIDRPLREGIARWRQAVEAAPEQYSAHEELAMLAERRDEHELAAKHYKEALRLKPDRRKLLLDLAQVEEARGDAQSAMALRLAVSRGGEPRLAETARAMLPERYPYPYEFERAMKLDPGNVELMKEYGYLLLEMKRTAEATELFKRILELSPGDEKTKLQVDMIEGRVTSRPEPEKVSDAKTMAERSLEKSYLNDALRYYRAAHEEDPEDAEVMLGLGRTYNQLGRDTDALWWFDRARKTGRSQASGEAALAYRRLYTTAGRFHVTTWMLPFYSSRWQGGIAYGQVKGEWRLTGTKLRPYVSMRVMGDTEGRTSENRVNPYFPAYLSESAVIFAAGANYSIGRRTLVWGEAGRSVSYLRRPYYPQSEQDYRGGVSWFRGWGHHMGGENGTFIETNLDSVYVSRFRHDLLFYAQARTGYTAARNFQFLMNWQVTADRLGEYWGNFVEVGPGVRVRLPGLPEGLSFRVDALRGVFLRNGSNPLRPNYWDVRSGFWYAFTR